MLSRLGVRVAARPRQSLLVLFVVFLLTVVIGGPTVGLLNAGDDFQPPNSGSELATERIEVATGAHDGPGVVALVETPGGADAPAARSRIAEMRKPSPPGRESSRPSRRSARAPTAS